MAFCWNKNNRKGKIGEKIIKKFLEQKGYVVYSTSTPTSHAFDFLAVKNKEKAIIAECKTYPKRRFYNDTGIDVRHYYDYKNVFEKYKIPIFLFFIDDIKNEVYGNWLHELEKEYYDYDSKIKYPLQQSGRTGEKIYFSLKTMKHIAFLEKKEIEELKQLTAC
jgi:hypothetical protein